MGKEQNDTEKGIELDQTALNLYNLLGGIDTTDRSVDLDNANDALLEELAAEERAVDERREKLIDAAGHTVALLQKARLGHPAARGDRELANLIDILSSFDHAYDHFDGALITAHGDSPDAALVSTGVVLVNERIAKNIVRKWGVKSSHLPGRFVNAMGSLTGIGIYSLRLRFERSDGGAQALSASLAALADFYKYQAQSALMHDPSPELVLNRHGKPDVNLTVLARVSRIPAEEINRLIPKLATMLENADDNSQLARFPNIYEALFAVKGIQERLVRPSIEINNLRWLMPGSGRPVSAGDARLTREVGTVYTDAWHDVAGALGCLSADTYHRAAPETVASKMKAAGRLLARLKGEESRLRALRKIRSGLDRASDAALAHMRVSNGGLYNTNSGASLLEGGTTKGLTEAVRYYQLRASAKKKIDAMSAEATPLSKAEEKVMAHEFGVSEEAFREIMSALGRCFSGSGRFHRRPFEEAIPLFVRHDAKVFEFLWRFLDTLPDREDRVALLNGLQALFGQLENKSRVMDYLLGAFLDGEELRFSDRNLLLLTIILVRKYNKESHANIEVTPEEVLRVRSLDDDMVATVGRYMTQWAELFFEKARAMHEQMSAQLETEGEGKIRFFFSTLREYFIFLSLMENEVSNKIIRMAVKELSNPAARVYAVAHGKKQMRWPIQLLQVTLRGFLRFADENDRYLVDAVEERLAQFDLRYKKTMPDGGVERLRGYLAERES